MEKLMKGLGITYSKKRRVSVIKSREKNIEVFLKRFDNMPSLKNTYQQAIQKILEGKPLSFNEEWVYQRIKKLKTDERTKIYRWFPDSSFIFEIVYYVSTQLCLVKMKDGKLDYYPFQKVPFDYAFALSEYTGKYMNQYFGYMFSPNKLYWARRRA